MLHRGFRVRESWGRRRRSYDTHSYGLADLSSISERGQQWARIPVNFLCPPRQIPQRVPPHPPLQSTGDGSTAGQHGAHFDLSVLVGKPPRAHRILNAASGAKCLPLHGASSSSLFLQAWHLAKCFNSLVPETLMITPWGRCIIHISLKAEMRLGEPAQNATRGSLPCGGG